MRSLLDVNLLLALFDQDHTHHQRANTWWRQHQGNGWASCPLTENGFVRIISGPSYPRRIVLAEALKVLRAQIALGGHELWPDSISIANPQAFDQDRILGPKQLTDIYLLALAVKNGGRLATFDRTIPLAAVRGAKTTNLAVL